MADLFIIRLFDYHSNEYELYIQLPPDLIAFSYDTKCLETLSEKTIQTCLIVLSYRSVVHVYAVTQWLAL